MLPCACPGKTGLVLGRLSSFGFITAASAV